MKTTPIPAKIREQVIREYISSRQRYIADAGWAKLPDAIDRRKRAAKGTYCRIERKHGKNAADSWLKDRFGTTDAIALLRKWGMYA